MKNVRGHIFMQGGFEQFLVRGPDEFGRMTLEGEFQNFALHEGDGAANAQRAAAFPIHNREFLVPQAQAEVAPRPVVRRRAALFAVPPLRVFAAQAWMDERRQFSGQRQHRAAEAVEAAMFQPPAHIPPRTVAAPHRPQQIEGRRFTHPVGHGVKGAADLICEFATEEHPHRPFRLHAGEVAQGRVQDLEDNRRGLFEQLGAVFESQAQFPRAFEAAKLGQRGDEGLFDRIMSVVSRQFAPSRNASASHTRGQHREAAGIQATAEGEQVATGGMQITFQGADQQLPQACRMFGGRCGQRVRWHRRPVGASRRGGGVGTEARISAALHAAHPGEKRAPVREQAVPRRPDGIDEGIKLKRLGKELGEVVQPGGQHQPGALAPPVKWDPARAGPDRRDAPVGPEA